MISLVNVMTARIQNALRILAAAQPDLAAHSFVWLAVFRSPKRSVRANSGSMTNPPSAAAESI
jgi:hypothetical protein